MQYKNKTILVTGATGLIGSHLVRRLINDEANVIALGRSLEKLQLVFAEEQDNDCLRLVCGDVGSGLADLAVNVDYIFHAASPISGEDIKSNPVDTIKANINGIINCLDFLRSQGNGRLIVFSSATVYGSATNEDISVLESKTDGADVLHSLNAPYSESKRMIEVLAGAYLRQYAVDSVIVRIGYVYGYAYYKPKTAFYEFIANVICGDNIILNNSGFGRRDNIFVDDVVEGLLIVAERGVSGEAYNLSTNGEKGSFKAIDEIANEVAAVANEMIPGNKVKVLTKESNEKRKPGVMLDNNKAKELGWKIRVDLNEGIKETIAKYLED